MSQMTGESVTPETGSNDTPLTVAEWRELQMMIREVHDFVMTLQNIGLQVAEGSTPMAIMLRNMVPSLLAPGN